jgi:hypothetical protein
MPWTWWKPHSIGLIMCMNQFQLSEMLYTSSKVYESPNYAKTHCKTYAWNVKVPSNEQRYWWATCRSMMLWISSLSLKNLLYNILKVSSFYRKKVANYIIFSELLTKNSSSRTQKKSPIGSVKVAASMVGGMFAVVAISYWGERLTEVGTGFGLLGTIPWCVMASYSAAWEAVAMVVA